MGSSTVTVTGLAEAKAAIDKLPDVVAERLKAVAKDTAERIAVRAAEILTSKTHGSGKTAASIRVLDESDKKRFDVNVPGDPERPAMLPVWLEHGTRYMAARPFLRPAGDAESERYKADMLAAVTKAVSETLK